MTIYARWEGVLQDDEGNLLLGAQVEVRRETPGAPLATLYADRSGATPLSNPFVSTDGKPAFHVAGGAYKITATLGAFQVVRRYVPIGLAAESDGVSYIGASATSVAIGTGSKTFAGVAGVSYTAGQRVISVSDADEANYMQGVVTSYDGDELVVDVDVTGGSGTYADWTINLAPGADGVDGVSAGYLFKFDSATSMADPGAGDIRLNHATLSSVTAAAISDLSAAVGNPDVSAAILAWDDSTNPVRGTLIIKKKGAPQNIAIYNVVGASTDNSGWTQLALSHVASAGSFANGNELTIEFSRAGDQPPANLPRSYLAGLGLANNATDPTNDVDIAPGAARDSTDAANIVLAATLTKQLDASWAVGSNQGGLDGTESVAGTPDVSTWYHVWLIKRSDTGVVDVLFSESATSPSMPANYDLKRRIGAVYNDAAGNILAFTQVGDDVWWTTAVLDFNTTIGNARELVTVTAPPGTKANVRAFASHGTSANVLLQPTTETDAAPSASAPPGVSLRAVTADVGAFVVPTDASGRIAVRASAATTTLRIWTVGYTDRRGRDA